MKYTSIIWEMDRKYDRYLYAKRVRFIFFCLTLLLTGLMLGGILSIGDGLFFAAMCLIVTLASNLCIEGKPKSTKPSDLFAWYLHREIDLRTRAKFANRHEIIQLCTQEMKKYAARIHEIGKEKTRISILPHSPATQAMLHTLLMEREENLVCIQTCEARINQASDDIQAQFELIDVWNAIIDAQMGKVQFIQETVMPRASWRKPFGRNSLKTDTSQLQKEIEDALKSMFDHPDFQDPHEQTEKTKDESLTPT